MPEDRLKFRGPNSRNDAGTAALLHWADVTTVRPEGDEVGQSTFFIGVSQLTTQGIAMSRNLGGPGDYADRGPAGRYGIAIAASFVAIAVQYALQLPFGERFPLAALPGAVVVAAWFGGLGPGLLATAGGTLAAAYFLWDSSRRFSDPGYV